MAGHSNIFANKSADFKKALAKKSLIQRFSASGQMVINYDIKKYPFPKIIVDLLLARGFMQREAPLDRLHEHLSSDDMKVDGFQINNIVKSFYTTNDQFYELYKSFMENEIFPVFGERFFIQRNPTNRFSFPFSDGMTKRDFHSDIMLGHPPEETNIWVPFTDASLSQSFVIVPLDVSLDIMASYGYDMVKIHHAIWHDEQVYDRCCSYGVPITLKPGEAILFDSRCLHAAVLNQSDFTRVSMDVRFILEKDYNALPFPYIGTGRRKAHFSTDDYYDEHLLAL